MAAVIVILVIIIAGLIIYICSNKNSQTTKIPKIPAPPTPVLPSDIGTTDRVPKPTLKLVDLIKAEGNIRYIDNRQKNGALWIIGGPELEPFTEKCRTHGVRFTYKSGGGQCTHRRPAWWTTDEVKR